MKAIYKKNNIDIDTTHTYLLYLVEKTYLSLKHAYLVKHAYSEASVTCQKGGQLGD